MSQALAQHDQLLRKSIETHDGYVFSTGRDGFGAAFARAGDAVAAAVEAQDGLGAEVWPDGDVIEVRMGLHTGEVEERDRDYFGPPVNRTARLMAVADGGQIVCSRATAEPVDSVAVLRELGEHRLRDLAAPQAIFQVSEGTFPPLRTLDDLPGNLPVQLRRREITTVTARSGDRLGRGMAQCPTSCI